MNPLLDVHQGRVEVINDTTIMVNLDAPPKLPFDVAEIKSQVGSGWVKVERRADGLYVDGRKVILYLSKRQKGKKVIRGYGLWEEVSGRPVLHPNIMDALIEYSHLIPEDWKRDEKGNVRYIHFWAVIFWNSLGHPYVRCFYFRNDRWKQDYHRFSDEFGFRSPAALLES